MNFESKGSTLKLEARQEKVYLQTDMQVKVGDLIFFEYLEGNFVAVEACFERRSSVIYTQSFQIYHKWLLKQKTQVNIC